MNDIVFENVSKSFDGKKVLNGFSYVFEGGKTTCIMGRSGCGKTTLLNIVSGTVSPDSGSISGVPERLSMVFQEDRLCEDFTAVRNVLITSDKVFGRKNAESILNEIGLTEDDMKKPVGELSGGMKRRVAIARALCRGFDCILLDEPFKGLDPDLKKNVISFVKKQTEGKTVIIVTHDPEEAKEMGGKIVDMSKVEY